MKDINFLQRFGIVVMYIAMGLKPDVIDMLNYAECKRQIPIYDLCITHINNLHHLSPCVVPFVIADVRHL